MAIMHILVDESLCQATTGRISVLEYMLLGIKWHYFLRTSYRRTPRRGYRGLGCVPSWGVRIRHIGLTGAETLPAHRYQDGGNDWCGLLPGLVLS
jgi:hypothetical protein